MSTPAPTAFRASYSDWKLIRSRKVVQIVLELPIELSGQAYDVLGGMPNPASEVWVGVARLKDGAARDAPREPDDDPCDSDALAPAKSARAHRSWHEMTPAQQAGVLCADKSFQNYMACPSEDDAAKKVRWLCGVTSRRHIPTDSEPWRKIVSEYRAWVRDPEYIG